MGVLGVGLGVWPSVTGGGGSSLNRLSPDLWLDAGRSEVVPSFSPLDLSPALWLDASDTSTITASSGAVSEWRDRSGNGRHVSQGTAAAQPTTGSATQNGLNVLSFDGSADFLTHDAGSDAIDLSPVTLFVVAYDDNSTQTADTYRRLVSMRRSSDLSHDYEAPNLQLLKTNTTREATATLNGNSPSAVAYSNQQAFIVAVKGSSSGGSLQINNDTPTTTASSMNVANMRYVRIGRGSARPGNPPPLYPSGDAWLGRIAEIVAYNATLNDSDTTKVRNYLASKWGVTL